MVILMVFTDRQPYGSRSYGVTLRVTYGDPLRNYYKNLCEYLKVNTLSLPPVASLKSSQRVATPIDYLESLP
ncbi:hypothetical protein pEp_SNUABM11_00004 [Erwinia phage pEp_SNUABM_11]|nr:hypothetical protein pEp_SNUABM11_00004 [Erwinia phage pEp_SNUABM_11]